MLARSLGIVELGTAAASAWSAGISLYGVFAVVGIAGRLEWIDANPFFERPEVIGIALVLFVIELFVDKIPIVDTLWDTVHTVLRPVGGALIVAMAPGQEIPTPVMIAAGAGLSLSSHAAKATTRVLVNTSPEPASNIVVSVLEDGLVAAVMTVAILYPRVALVLTLVLAVFSAVFSVIMFRTARRAWRKIQDRRAERRQRRSGHPPGGSPAWEA